MTVEEAVGRILPEELLDSVVTIGDVFGWYGEMQLTRPDPITG